LVVDVEETPRCNKVRVELVKYCCGVAQRYWQLLTSSLWCSLAGDIAGGVEVGSGKLLSRGIGLLGLSTTDGSSGVQCPKRTAV
jgi:hypothetical protein